MAVTDLAPETFDVVDDHTTRRAFVPRRVKQRSASPTPLTMNRDEEFAAIYRANHCRVRALVTRQLFAADLVDDVVQDTFLLAYRALDSYDRSRPAWPWLSVIARNACTDAGRALQRRRAHLTDEEPLEDQVSTTATDPAELHDARMMLEDVIQALHGLTDRQRTLLIGKEIHGLSHRALAIRESSSIDAVKSAIKRARQRVKEATAVPTIDIRAKEDQ